MMKVGRAKIEMEVLGVRLKKFISKKRLLGVLRGKKELKRFCERKKKS